MKSFLLLFLVFLLCSCSQDEPRVNSDEPVIKGLAVGDLHHVRTQLAKFSPTELTLDSTELDDTQQKVLDKLIKAARFMDEIFMGQVYGKNFEIRKKLIQSKNPQSEPYLKYFMINFGPFDRLEGEEPFIGSEEKPLGATFYPEDMTVEEFEEWIEKHPEDRETFESSFTVIRRQGDALTAIPYSEVYGDLLKPAARALTQAAELTTNASLKRYLESRARAFLSNDYYESDMAWMDLEGNLVDPTIGPYEVYEDRLLGYKAAFEAFITIKDLEESEKFADFGTYLPKLEMNLPIPDEYKNTSRGLSSPTSVATEVFTAGDTKSGVQTIAFNLPNDERVREAKGSKKVMLKNVIRAKFDNILKPIAGVVLAGESLGYVDFDSYFYEIYMHEMAHGLGPGNITLDGRETTVNKELREHYSVIEEAKADIVGLLNVFYFQDNGKLEFNQDQTLATFLAGIFRSIRFGVNEAHGGANLIELNFLLEEGFITLDESTLQYSINFETAKQGVRELARELLMLEAEGDYDGTTKFIEHYGVLDDNTEKVLESLTNIPVDIAPVFVLE